MSDESLVYGVAFELGTRVLSELYRVHRICHRDPRYISLVKGIEQAIGRLDRLSVDDAQRDEIVEELESLQVSDAAIMRRTIEHARKTVLLVLQSEGRFLLVRQLAKHFEVEL